MVDHLLENRLDLVNAARNGTHERPGHRFGNDLFNRITGWVFGSSFEDMLSNRYPLEQINEALEAMRAFREVKAVVVL